MMPRVEVNRHAPARVGDRRVRRSRAALMRAAVGLVAERGTTALTVSDIAEAADVSRQLVYQQFSDRDALLIEAARDLAERELMPLITEAADAPNPAARIVAVTSHFAEHRAFYRPMLTGSCAFGLGQVLHSLLDPFNQQVVLLMSDQQLAPDLLDDLTGFVTGGFGAVFNAWVVDGREPLDPQAFADRLIRMLSFVAAAVFDPDAISKVEARRRATGKA